MEEVICLMIKNHDMKGIDKKDWKDFRLLDYFEPEKGNQNNMSSLVPGRTPLVSAKKCDNGYKDFISPNAKSLFKGGILTINNDGDGGAGISYYQPYSMALDSHVTALFPRLDLDRFQLLFIAVCITKQRNRFGHGYSLNSNRLRAFRIMLPINSQQEPDWNYMGDYMRTKEHQILGNVLAVYKERMRCNMLKNKELRGG